MKHKYTIFSGLLKIARERKREYNEIMTETITEEKIKELGEKIAREFKPEKIILFGSLITP